MKAALLFSILALLPALATAQTTQNWIGVQGCKNCHKREYKIWKKGPHAKAGSSIKKEERTAKNNCKNCHFTGKAPLGKSVLPDVQCEACHGKGGNYAKEDIMKDATLSFLLGLRKLGGEDERNALCLTCHRVSTSLRSFDVENSWKRIAH